MNDVRLFPYEANVITKVENIPDGVKLIQAPAFWDKGLKGEGIKIAIIDTGCDVNHQDLRDRIIDKKNFTTDDNGAIDNVTDYVGHGTHCAGIIAANENGDGVVGVAPRAQLLILKALSRQGGRNEWIVKAIDYAVSQQVDIISMSLGGKYNDVNTHNAVIHAVANGVLVVAAAGNDGDGSAVTSEVNYPAAYNESISVGSVDLTKHISKFSASNAQVDILAPGQKIISTAPNNGYVEMSGTSMATPHVAGALALIKNWITKEFNRKLTVNELYAQLIKKTVSLGYPKPIEGNGMLYLTADEILKTVISREDILNSISKA